MGIIETARKIAKSKNAIPPLKFKTSEKIASIMQEAIREGSSLEIAIDIRVQKFYSDRIIRKDNFEGLPALVIDTVMPEEHGRRALETSEFLEISFHLGGDPYTFQSRFLAMGEERFSTVTIAYPAEVLRHQFRTAERFFLTPDDPPVFVKLEFPVTTKILGTEVAVASDISVDGLSFLTANNKLEPETSIKVEIEFPDVSPMDTKAVVMQLTDLKDQEFPYKCGIRFEGVSKSLVEGISRFIQNEKKAKENLDENVYNIERITRIALHKTKIRARLEGREVSEKEQEEMKDFLEFKNIELDESLDL
ncbi:MAG: PilZ domain-containing protein [Nitrospinae bacterium]|nr:PilZ domain-containing protein [Nitrospinota bacterium]